MSTSVGAVNGATCSIVAPQKERQKSPWVLDESLPKARNPQEVYYERMKQRQIDRAKNKSDDERNVFDYMILAQEKLKDLNTVMYLA
jgi:hypothetical protein